MHNPLHVCFVSLERINRNIFRAEMFLHFTLEKPAIRHVVFKVFVIDRRC
jgi:hypothetical protein